MCGAEEVRLSGAPRVLIGSFGWSHAYLLSGCMHTLHRLLLNKSSTGRLTRHRKADLQFWCSRQATDGLYLEDQAVDCEYILDIWYFISGVP